MITKDPYELLKHQFQELLDRQAVEVAEKSFIKGWKGAIGALVKTGYTEAAGVLQYALDAMEAEKSSVIHTVEIDK